MVKQFSKTAIATAVIAASFISAQALAQRQLEEVIVTAQKMKQNVNDVSLTISAYTQERMDALGVKTIEDMGMTTPGLVVYDGGLGGTSAWTLRGVGFQDYSTAASSTVGFYIDEVAIPFPVMMTGQIYDISRVEVLKGPQGDLYGRNTTAGQMSVYSNRPTEEFQAGITAGIGNYATWELEGYVSGAMGDTTRGRLAFRTTQRGDGWQESATRPGDELGEKDLYSVRAMFDWDVTEDFTAQFTVSYNDDQSDGLAHMAVAGSLLGLDEDFRPGQQFSPFTQEFADTVNGGSPPNFPDDFKNLAETAHFGDGKDHTEADWTNGPNGVFRPQRDNQLMTTIMKLQWQVGDVEITSVTGYQDFERAEAGDSDGWAGVDGSVLSYSDITVFSQEIRAAGSWGDNITWIIGAFYAEDDMEEDYNYYFGDGFYNIKQLDTHYWVEGESYSIFGHAEWDINDQWGLNMGARYTWSDSDFDGCTNDVTPADVPGVAGLYNLHEFLAHPAVGLLPLTPNTCGVVDLAAAGAGDWANFYPDSIRASLSEDDDMWKIGVDYRPSDNVLTYFNISKGIKTGGFNGANLNTAQQVGPYTMETLEAYEIGFKATLMDDTMQLNGAAFYYDYEDKQEPGGAVTPVGVISGLTNVPESEIIGAELSLQWYATDRLRIEASTSYLDTEVKKYDAVQDGSSLGNIITADVSGFELHSAPEWSHNVTAAYDIPVGEYTLTPAADYIYVDSRGGEPGQEWQRAPSYSLVNLRATLVPNNNDDWSLTAWGRNIGDEEVIIGNRVGGNATYMRTFGMARTYGLTLDYRF
ncbi:MAG: TonB-dependent receptor [Halieaceae bacterium]|jgi:iron complex outermembrane recepter protein|nr:TonB-dependent receptor [Halieaceae bacterium]